MRRTVIILLVVAMLAGILAIPAMAAEPRIVNAVTDLDITGTTATCSLRATGNSTSEYLKATIKLYRGSVCIATWNASGNGYLFFSETKTIVKGYTYKMTVDLTIDGEDIPVPDVYKTI